MGCFLRLLLALATNALALWVCDKLFDGVQIHGFWAYAIGSAVLGFMNAIVKPILAILTLPLVILTLGFFYLLIAIGMVALTEWITPNFSVTGFWDYVGVVFIVWLVNWAVGTLLDRSSKTTIVISR
jgi:putative membrane protein